MLVRFAKVDPSRYRLSIVRTDGSAAARELETRSYLPHDLMHFAVELEAGLMHSFFGRLAAGSALAPESDMGRPEAVPGSEAKSTEIIVGAFQSLAKRRKGLSEFVPMLGDYLRLQGYGPPDFLTTAFAARVLDRYDALFERWKSLPLGGELTLRFPD